MSVSEQLQELEQHFAKYQQQHVFKFINQLNDQEKQSLHQQLKDIDLDQVVRMYESIQKPEKKMSEQKVTPFEKITDLPHVSAEQQQLWYHTGLQAIADGKLALLLMGGGQGTRLGYNLPKGLYDIGLPSHKSLLQLQAERLKRLKQVAAQHAGKNENEVSLPWYVMTSTFTHKDTVEYFEKNNFFGLPKSDFFFFEQGMLPCLTMDGKIILESAGRVSSAPNGNGGVYEGLLKSGALEDMEKRGIAYVHAYCVDNVLVKVADPTFAGFCISSGTDCCNKVVRKRDPTEKVGVMCYCDGVPSVVEYSEISKEMSEMRDDKNQLVYGAANIANHFFTLSFLQHIAKTPLPFHQATKKIPFAGDDGKTVQPASPNGIKLEMFVFDVFPFAQNLTAFAVLREGEFSPLKNAPGSGLDTPETCRKDLSDYHISLVKKAGGDVRTDFLEISPLISYDGEGLEPHILNKPVETNHLC